MLLKLGLASMRHSFLYRKNYILFFEGLQLDWYSLPIREATRCHSGLLGQCCLHPRRLAALPHQAHGLLQRLKGQLVLQTGSTHTSRQLSSLCCPGQDLHIWGVRSRWVQRVFHIVIDFGIEFSLKSIWSWCFYCVLAGSSALDLFECYDTRTESWQVKPSMLMARCSHGSVEANGLIYVCGGTVGNNVSGRVLNNCEVYDPSTQQWVGALWKNQKKSHHRSESVINLCLCSDGGSYVGWERPGRTTVW